MKQHSGGGYHFPDHVDANVDALDSNRTEELDVRLSLNQKMTRTQATRNLAGKINRRGFGALQIAAQLPFDVGRAAEDVATAQIATRRDMNIAVGADGAAKARRDFIIPQIEMRTTLRTGR